jgi:hypothetical protein
MRIKLLLPLLVVSSVVGCSSSPKYANDNITPAPVYKLKNYDGPEAMNNQEVVQASKQCIFNKMRPNVSYLSVRTDQGKTLVPVSVICEPMID